MDKLEGKLYTSFGEELLNQLNWQEDVVPLAGYPRPQMVRDSYLCLNGWWDYAIARGEEAFAEKTCSSAPESGVDPALAWGRILVPFSPEAPLSTVDQVIYPEDRLYYRRSFRLPDSFNVGHALLHFDAVDYRCCITLNGHFVGEHKGGFFAFSFDVTPYILEDNVLELEVTDPTDTSYIARGKQRLHRGTIWYSPQSGIWQTVWLESVPEDYIEAFRMTPDIDRSLVHLEIESSLQQGHVAISEGGRVLAQGLIDNRKADILFEGYELWSPENPRLYDVEITVGLDVVKSYVGMRKFSLGPDRQGIPRLCLNNRPYFHNGVLDQGYYPDGLLTPPSDEAMISDITAMKDLGFNMLRKHIKIEPLRWYYHCDRIGMIVWQDMVNGGRDRFMIMNILSLLKIPCRDKHHWFFGRREKAGRDEYMEDAKRTIQHLYNTTSLGMWVPFNESWGQFDADRVSEWVAAQDSSRTIDRYSGWHNQGNSDFTSLHIYFRAFKIPANRGKCVLLSEFGGYSCKEPGHNFIARKDFGYKKFADKASLSLAYRELFEKEIIPAIPLGLSAAVYTQLSDVEDEVNGILTYDRKVQKIDSVKPVNDRIGHEWRRISASDT